MTQSSWSEFVRDSSSQIGGIARRLVRSYRLPRGVEVGDIEQEAWLGAWRAWSTWDASRGGMSRTAFAVCSSRLVALRWVHGQRNSARRDGKSPGRYPSSECALSGTLSGTTIEELAGTVAPGQLAASIFLEAVRHALADSRGKSQRAALRVLLDTGFDLKLAAAQIGARRVRETLRELELEIEK